LNNLKDNLHLVLNTDNGKNISKRSDNKSGINGVGFRTIKNVEVWFATWKEDGKDKSKSFSCNKYGFENAKTLAIKYRENKIQELIEQGKAYSERHGK
jgi:hypothetical protein